MAEEVEEDWEKGLRYCIRLIIKHPNIDPAMVTAKLGLTPNGRTWLAGSPIATPQGAPLPSVYAESAWLHSIDIHDKRRFFSEVVQLLDHLEPHSEFLSEIIDSGGRVSITVDLFGERNIGDVLNSEHLQRLGALQVNLGIEVF